MVALVSVSCLWHVNKQGAAFASVMLDLEPLAQMEKGKERRQLLVPLFVFYCEAKRRADRVSVCFPNVTVPSLSPQVQLRSAAAAAASPSISRSVDS